MPVVLTRYVYMVDYGDAGLLPIGWVDTVQDVLDAWAPAR